MILPIVETIRLVRQAPRLSEALLGLLSLPQLRRNDVAGDHEEVEGIFPSRFWYESIEYRLH